MQNVLDLMLYSYSFMVSGLFVPVIGTIILKKPSANAAFYSMICGGGVTLLLILSKLSLPLDLDANIFGITCSALIFTLIQTMYKKD